MRVGELSCGPKKEPKAFGLIFHWQQWKDWKEREYLKASVVGLILGSQSQGMNSWARPSQLAQRSQYPPEAGQLISRGNSKCWVYCMKNLSGWVILRHRQISCSCSGLNQAVKATPGRQSEGSVYKDPKRLTQLGLKLLWVYQWFMQCKSKWQKARFCHFHLQAGMLASSSKY